MITRDDILNLLRAVRSDDSFERVKQIFDVLDDYELQDYLSSYEIVMFESVDAGDEEVAQAIMRNSQHLLCDVLREQGIYLDADVSLENACELARATREIVDYEDSDGVLAICDGQVDDLDTYIQLVRLVSGLSEDQIYLSVEKVSVDLIDRICESVTQVQQAHERDEKAQATVTRYMAWKAKCEGRHWFADQYVLSTSTVGLPFATYYSAYNAVHVIPVEPHAQQLTAIAEELFALALLSCDAGQNILQGIRAVIADLYHDLRYSMPLGRIVDRLFSEYNRI
jgi:hypothetical protein